MAVIPVQKASDATAITMAAAAAGDTFPHSRRRALRVNNGSGAPITVTIVAQKPCDQGVLHDRVVTVAAGAEKLIPAGLERFADDVGQVHVTYSATASVTRAAVEI